jgi:hypothetical protein
MDMVIAANEPSTIERRYNTRLRAIFPDACSRMEHFFHGSQDWGDRSREYLALRVTYESYPDLSAEEVYLLITAIERRAADRVCQHASLETEGSGNDSGVADTVSPRGVVPLLEVLKRIQLQ